MQYYYSDVNIKMLTSVSYTFSMDITKINIAKFIYLPEIFFVDGL